MEQRLGESLVELGVCTPDQIRIAVMEQRSCDERLGQILVRLGFSSEAVIQDVLAGGMGRKCVSLEAMLPDADALRMIPETLARRCGVVPLRLDASRRCLSVALPDMDDLAVLDELERQLAPHRITLQPELATRTDIGDAQDRFYGFAFSLPDILHRIESEGSAVSDEARHDDAHGQPIAQLVDALLSDAVKRGASDIHIEPEQGFLRIRYRIDGVLRQICSLHRDYWSRLLVRIKVMAALDIAESRTAQDGRFSQSLCGKVVDFRVSTLPTIHGENIVLRVLDRHKGILALDALGLDAATLDELQPMLFGTQGLMLITGPTGSGKTTTLYSMLHQLNDESNNIMTLEDPVEYPASLIRQTSINELVKLNYANGMRALMRQDPDIILIGEIRDEHTAHMTFRAVMTGHRVFSTLHTVSTLGAITRLRELGVGDEIMAGNISGIISQRLLRYLCAHCKRAYDPASQPPFPGMQWLGPPQLPERLWEAVGCPCCAMHGYNGRFAVQEILRPSRGLDALIARHSPSPVLYDFVLRKGFRSLAERGLERIWAGSTSLQELARVEDLSVYMRRRSAQGMPHGQEA